VITSVLPPTADISPAARVRAVWISVAILFAIYLVAFFAGVRFFIYKTAMLPLLLAYGLLVRERLAFVLDWLPFIGVTLFFDAVRGGIYHLIKAGYLTYHVDYVVRLEEAVFGLPALTLLLQVIRTGALDMAAVLVHASHFLFFFLFGLALWHARREHFRYYRRALVLVMLFGLVGYVVIPTAPPWMAAAPYFAKIPPLVHIGREIYTDAIPDLYGAFSSNPVAAMPSLHVAFPTACAIVAWRAYGSRLGLVFGAYALIVMFAAVYLGDHYGVDVIAGVGVAVLATYLAGRMAPLALSPRATLAVSAALIALTAALAITGPRLTAAHLLGGV